MKKHLLMLCAAVIAATMSLEARVILIDEGFENGIQDSVWTQEFEGAEMPWAVEDTVDGLSYPATVVQGSKRAFLRNPTNETIGYKTRLVSKVMDLNPLTVPDPELIFFYANPRWGGDRDTLRVLYRTATSGADSKWKQMAEYSTASADWQRVKIKLPDVGRVYQIAFEGKDNLGHGIVLDSIKLQSAAQCRIPDHLTVANKGAGVVRLSWSGSYDVDEYELIITRDTIDPDLIAEIEESEPEKIVFHDLVGDSRHYELKLEPGEFYLAYVRSICDEGEEISAWSSEVSKDGPFGFHVRPTLQVPFTETFNTVVNPDDPTRLLDWTWKSNTGNPNPYINTKMANANYRANYSHDKSYAVIFSGGANTNTTTLIPADRYVYLATPALADTTREDFALNQCQVHFWATVYTATGRQYGSGIIVGVMDDPDDIMTFVPVDTVRVWGHKTHEEYIIDLGGYNGTGTFLAFVSQFDRDNLFYLDDVTVEYRQAQNKVTEIIVNPRDTYATISWDGNASSYNVLITNTAVDPANVSADFVVDMATVQGNSYECEALEANHNWNNPYYVYVQADGQEWSNGKRFVTLVSKRDIPYSYDFEAKNTPVFNLPSDNSNYMVGMGIFGNCGTYPALVSNSSNSYAGSGYLYMNKRGGTDTWITLPMVENLEEVQVKFYLSGGSTYEQAHATVGVMSNPMEISTFVPVSSFKLNNTGYTRCYANFEHYNDPEGVIAIIWDDIKNMTENTINYIDELTVDSLSDCVPPTNIELDILPDSITARWETSLSDKWEFFISRTAIPASQRIHKTREEIAAMGGVIVADTLKWEGSGMPTFGFGGLTPHMKYYLYVRATCDMEWWTEMAFNTPCKPEEFPYKETFETFNVNATSVGCWQLADYMGVGYPQIAQAGTTTASNKVLELYSSGSIHRSLAIMPEIEGSLSSMLLSFEVRSKSTSSSGLLIVGTMGDIEDENTFIPFDTIQVASGSEFQKVRLILSNYNLAHENIVFTSGLGAKVTASDVYIDNVELKDPSCIEPYDIKQIGLEPDAFDIEWKGVAPNDQWELKVLNKYATLSAVKNGTYDESYDIVPDTILAGKSFHLGGLQARSTYYVYIHTLCGDSVWTAATVHTSCDYLNPNKPNQETFESYSEGVVPDCWTVGTRTGTGTNPSIYTLSSNKVFSIKQSLSSCPHWIASPVIKCDSLSSMLVSFDVSTYDGETCVFGVMTNPADLSTFVPLDSVDGTGSSNFMAKSYDLSVYANRIPASAKYIAWRGTYDDDDYIYLDNVSIISMACPMPNPAIEGLTKESVQIGSGLRTSAPWILLLTNHEVSADDLANEDYVVPADWIVSRDTVSKRSKEIFGLEGQTKYYVAAATLCEDSIVSMWKTISFMTPCVAMSPEQLGTITFSKDEGFEVGAGKDMPCWIVGNKSQGAPAENIPYVDNSTSHNSQNYLRMHDEVSTSSSYVGAYAIMPELDVDSISKYQVSFYARGYNSSTAESKLIVGVISDPTDLMTFEAMDTLNLSKTAWDPFSVGFEQYLGDYMGDWGKNIMFLSDFGASNYAYISEITVELIPRCRPIGTFSVDSVGEDAAVISFKGYQNTFRLLLANRALKESEKASYMYLLDTIVDHSDNIRLTGLESAANYYVYAQGICEDGDSTAISLTYAYIHTECPTVGGAALPFFDDFESYAKGEKQPGCWQLLGTSNSYFAVNEVSGNGTQAIDVWNSGYVVVPRVNGNLENLTLSFDVRQYSGSSSTFYVGVMSDVNDVTTFQLLETFTVAAADTFTHCEMQLGEYDLLYDNLVLTSGITNVTPSVKDNWLDNVGLDFVSACVSPKLKSESVSFNTATISLIPANRTDSLWEVAVIPDSIHTLISNINAYLDTTSLKMQVSSTTIDLTDLAVATSYDIYARTICSADEKSNWTRSPLKINTQFYYKDSYSFGFEKTELWQRSTGSASDNYYLHPALVTGRDSIGAPAQSYKYYPYSLENTSSQVYSRTGDGALRMFSNADYFGGYVIFPAVDEPKARSFEFKVRPGSVGAVKNQEYPQESYDGVLEIGTIEKGKDFSTYQPMASIRIDHRDPNVTAKSKNNKLYSNYTLDLDSATVADRQIVFHLPKQPMDTSNLFIDDVRLDTVKGYSLVALDKVIPAGNSALVQWQNIGSPWNLTIKSTNGTIVQSYTNLRNVTEQLVEGLDPLTEYVALLECANRPSGLATYTITSDQLSFRTLCQILEPNAYSGGFFWDFNESYDWEQNDIIAGEKADTGYYKPACFNVGITYPKPVNGYQWLIQRKGYEPTGSLSTYSATRHQEVGRNDSHALRVHTTATNYNSFIVLPELHCGYDTMMIEFYARCFVNYDDSYSTASYRGKIVDATYLGSNYSQSMVVGTLSNPSDFSTLEVIDTLRYTHTDLTASTNVNNDPSGLRYWELFQLPLTAAQGKYIVLFQPAPGLMYIDDLSVKPIGNTMFAPLNTQTTNITTTSATLSWSVRQPEMASVVVVTDAVGEEILRDTILGTRYDLTNLQGAKVYQWYVYQTNNNNDSPTSRPLSFATECVTIGPDYSCSFEPEEGAKNIEGQSANYMQTLCWTYGDAAQGVWTSGAYDPFNQVNTSEYNYSYTGTSAVAMRALYSSRTAYQPYIAMPATDVSAYDTLQVSFMIRPAYVDPRTGGVIASYTGSSYSKSIIVGTMTDPNDATTFVPLDTVTYDGTISTNDIATEANDFLFQQMQVELVGASGPYVAFMTSFYAKGSSAQKANDYLWLDEVRFERKNECKEPLNLTALQVATYHAVLTWNPIDSANGYWLQVSTDPYFADEEAFVFNEQVKSNTVRVERLSQQTTYVWRVRALCGEKWGESAFTSKETFTTTRSPYFFENFDAAVNANEWTFSKAHADRVVDSTGVLTRGIDNYSFTRTTNDFGLPGPHYYAQGYSGDYHWMVTPEFYLPADDSVHFSMNIALTACNSAHVMTGNAVTEKDMKDDYYFMIIISDDGGKTWKSENILAKWQNTNPEGMQLRDIPATGMKVRYSLAQYADKNIKIGFYREAKTASTTGIAIHLDSVRLAYFDKTIDYTSACQYEDVTVGDIHLSGDDTQPGIHSYPTCFYVSDAAALAGKRDSVFSLEIEIFPTQEEVIADTICEGDTYTALDFLPKTTSGVYRRKLQTIEHGCDSIVTLYLEVTARRYGEETEATICKGGEPYEWHGNYYNRAGVYRDTLVSSVGCDSIETLIVSYVSDAGGDTIYRHSTVAIQDLPFTYTDIDYAAGQAEIYYPEGTPKGEYVDTVRILVETCTATLIHTLTLYDRDEAIDNVDGETGGARKVIYQDRMYIILNEEWYTIEGQKVRDPRE